MNRPAGQRGPLRALLVDDHPLVRQALREIISRERDLAVCGEADDRERALAAMAACQPDLAILDLALKNSDGLELIKDIRLRYPGTLILVLSMYDGSHFAERAIRAGANGYVSKQEPPARIMQAVRKVLSGEIYWAEKVASQVASKVARPELETRSLPCDLLSERELQVFELIGTGASAAQIAAALHIGASTVESHRMHIRKKMHYGSAVELLQAAIRWNLTTRVLGQARGARCS
ncbi:MAG: response regulator transcription factor [Verrucomicrobiota bacterium]|jgi:DNA-binding NarL/FixJ family response regulator